MLNIENEGNISPRPEKIDHQVSFDHVSFEEKNKS